ncbi:MAG: cbb3-type cytochrome c oxidase subunit II [Thermodesulfobacteriota bacterium]
MSNGKGPIHERFALIFLFVGLGLFAFGTFWQAVSPWLSMRNIPYQKMEDIAKNIPPEFFELAEDYPEAFEKHFGEVGEEAFIKALTAGKKAYIAEACWHCHSQYVRPVSREEERYGKVSYPSEYQNAMHLPQLLGTRRVGVDLSREGGVHSNDWHLAHFEDAQGVTDDTVMPNYPWFFDEDGEPNEKGLGVTAYMQWLGSWVEDDTYQLPSN